MDLLHQALDNDDNHKFLHLNSKKIQLYKSNAIAELHRSQSETRSLLAKLRDYIYVDELGDLREGAYIRWIPIINPNIIRLTKGALFCEALMTDNGISIRYKNFNGGTYSLKPEECLLFQKLTQQEIVLIKALDYLD